ncbi:MAG: AAA family ATPase [Nanoarchaeota archaeon]|nr:AAA family ATPase [DPANN group archaeon]MBL7116983.1 AAA family ATPase [Nanoarchaeota archaeon]
MGTFDDILGHGESLIRNENALDFDFIPKLIPHREQEQRQIALAIKPLLEKRNGRNMFIYGKPGVGKTVAAKHVLRELEEKHDDIYAVYVNCWQQNTSYKVAVSICDQIGFKFVQNKNTTALFQVVARIVNEASAVFVFDEIDKVEDTDFLYHLLEDVYRKTILLITNYKDWISELDERVRSRLTAEQMEFKQYTPEETASILRDRLSYAFPEGVWSDEAFNIVAKKAGELKDIRSGLFLLKESAYAAEEKAKRNIEVEDVKNALSKLDDFTIKNSEELEDETKFIYNVVKENSGKKIGELFEIYQKKGGKSSYKTFQRKIKKLSENKFIKTTKSMGKGGTTTIVEKKLTEF